MNSLKETLNNCDTTTLDLKQQEILEALVSMGYLNGHMLTIAIPLGGPRRNDDWMKSATHVMMGSSFQQYDEHPQWMLVMNRGWDGKGEWSGHIIWKNRIPKHLGFFVRHWNGKYGTERAENSAHDNCLAYFVKNMCQPDARTHEGPYNRRNGPRRRRAPVKP